jgi:hypothetical protein
VLAKENIKKDLQKLAQVQKRLSADYLILDTFDTQRKDHFLTKVIHQRD